MNKHCCPEMQKQVTFHCGIHPDPFDCLDYLINYNEKFNEYGLVLHDLTDAVIQIKHCPFCGKKLPESKRTK